MQKRWWLLPILLLGVVVPGWVGAQDALPPIIPEQFYRGEVVEIVDEKTDDFGLGSETALVQTVKVRFLNGPRADEEETIEYGVLQAEQKVTVGQQLVLVVANDQTYIFDRYRLPTLGIVAVLFGAAALLGAGWRGATSLLGLGVSGAVLLVYVVPSIMVGKNPLFVSLVGAVVIAVVSIYLAHGWHRRTTVAVVSTLLTIVVAIGLAQFLVGITDLTGTGSEEAYHLQASALAFVNLQGLLLGGIVIGALGVLDDITTSQAAAVEEIWRANPALGPRELWRRGTRVGREHITSLINTLALAYVGASLPALLLFTIYQRPWWVVLNTETITEEIVRTLVGSFALILAVPITTLLAAYWLPKQVNNKNAATV